RLKWEPRTQWGRSLVMYDELTDFFLKLADAMRVTKIDLEADVRPRSNEDTEVQTLQDQIGTWISLRNAMPFAVSDRAPKVQQEGKIPGLLASYRDADATRRQALLSDLATIGLDEVAVRSVCAGASTSRTMYPGVVRLEGE